MDGRESVELSIEGMRCAGCADTIAAALTAVPGVAAVDVSDVAGLARVGGTRLSPATLIAAVARAGYVAAPTGALAAALLARREGSALLQAALLAALAHAPELPAPAGALLAVAALALPGRSFLVGAVRSLAARQATMDLLVALGAGAAALSALLVAAGLLPPACDHGH
ncbi:MAG: metal-transporting ATPase, partial [Planctomycetes bacterium]|nr:metal-transporting ATPase [Planctomycetota bacterium]